MTFRLLFLLAGFAPILATAAPAATRHVVLVTLDGVRWQEVFRGADESFLDTPHGGVPENMIRGRREAIAGDTVEVRRRKLLPFVWGEMAVGGQVFGNRDRGSRMNVRNAEWFSYPGYQEVLGGFADPLITSNAPVPNRNTTVLEWLNTREGLQGRVAAAVTWHVLPAIINVGRSRLPVWVSSENPALVRRSPVFADIDRWMRDIPWKARDEHYDAFAYRAALELIDVFNPRVLYVALGEPDTHAHARRYHDYLDAITRCDRFVRELWDRLQSLDAYRGTTTLLITTDHGRGGTPQDWVNHNKNTPHSNETWLAIMGPDTPARGERVDAADIHSAQVAATVAALLGHDFRAAEPRADAPVTDVLAGSNTRVGP